MSGIRLLVAGIGALVSISVIFLLVFVNGVIVQPITQFLFGGQYPMVFGMSNIPIIQFAIGALALIGCIISIAAIWVEVFSEISYFPEV